MSIVVMFPVREMLFIGILIYRINVPAAAYGGDFTTEFSTKNKGFINHFTVIPSTAPPQTANACYQLALFHLSL